MVPQWSEITRDLLAEKMTILSYDCFQILVSFEAFGKPKNRSVPMNLDNLSLQYTLPIHCPGIPSNHVCLGQSFKGAPKGTYASAFRKLARRSHKRCNASGYYTRAYTECFRSYIYDKFCRWYLIEFQIFFRTLIVPNVLQAVLDTVSQISGVLLRLTCKSLSWAKSRWWS